MRSGHSFFSALGTTASAGLVPILLAPMAGYSSSAMRRLARRFGAGLAYTEMVNAAALARNAPGSLQLLEYLAGDGPLVAHLYGNDPAEFAAAAQLIESLGGFAAIDINAGCPAPKITRSGAGAMLMENPKLSGKIVAAVRQAVKLPVSVKTRLGLRAGEVSIFSMLREIEEAGASAITLHARFASQGHAGPVALDLLAQVKQQSHIVVIGNGGITDGESARRMLAHAGVDALMIGQGAIGNPWIFQQIAHQIQGQADMPTARPSLEEVRSLLFEHIADELTLQRQMVERHPLARNHLTPEETVIVCFRCHFFRYLRGMKGVAHLRSQLTRLHSLADITAAVDQCLKREATFRSRRGSSN